MGCGCTSGAEVVSLVSITGGQAKGYVVGRGLGFSESQREVVISAKKPQGRLDQGWGISDFVFETVTCLFQATIKLALQLRVTLTSYLLGPTFQA